MKQSPECIQLVYGRKPIEEILSRRPEIIKEIFVSQAASGDQRVLALLSAGDSVAEIRRCSAEQLDAMTAGAVHQGLVAVLVARNESPLEDLIEKTLSVGAHRRLVVLDQLVDPHNIGAVYRASAAAGVDGLVITTDRSSPITPAVRKVSMGASEFVPTSFVNNLQRALRELKKHGVWILGTTLSEQADDFYDTQLPFPLAIIFGREGKGLRALTAKECDILVKIPMSASVESLNVSQAAAVVLFELQRREREEVKKADVRKNE